MQIDACLEELRERAGAGPTTRGSSANTRSSAALGVREALRHRFHAIDATRFPRRYFDRSVDGGTAGDAVKKPSMANAGRRSFLPFEATKTVDGTYQRPQPQTIIVVPLLRAGGRDGEGRVRARDGRQLPPRGRCPAARCPCRPRTARVFARARPFERAASIEVGAVGAAAGRPLHDASTTACAAAPARGDKFVLAVRNETAAARRLSRSPFHSA